MEIKKISFGFSKVAKKNCVLPTCSVKVEENVVEMIKCLEGQEIKLLEEKKEAPPLVIPLLENNKTSVALASLMKRRAVLLGEDDAKDEDDNVKSDGQIVWRSVTNVKDLEQQAAQELLAEAQTQNDNIATINSKLVLPISKPDELPLEGAKEPTVYDYENIPVQEFGLAMLRGMGWVEKPKKKAGSLPIDDGPVLRPKGMGLGADKALKPKPLLIQPEGNENLEIKKQSYVRILGGKHKDLYGQIEGFDDDHGRVIVKMAIGGAKESFNEFLCQPVAQKEFVQYGKCINSAMYDRYKRSENDHDQIPKEKCLKLDKDSMKTDARNEKANQKSKENPKTKDAYKFQRKREHELALNKYNKSKRFEKTEEKWNVKNLKIEKIESGKHKKEYASSSRYKIENVQESKKGQPRSRSLTPKRRRIIHEESTDSSKSSDDSDSAYERRSRTKKKSKKRNSTKHTKTSRRYRTSKSNSRSISLTSDLSDEDRRTVKKSKSHHKKKTKKSKKPRSRTHSRSRDRHKNRKPNL